MEKLSIQILQSSGILQREILQRPLQDLKVIGMTGKLITKHSHINKNTGKHGHRDTWQEQTRKSTQHRQLLCQVGSMLLVFPLPLKFRKLLQHIEFVQLQLK